MTGIVLFATGSPVIVDVEESIRRRGLSLAAGIRNVEGTCYLDETAKARSVHEVDAGLCKVPYLVPLFTPANRRAAVRDALRLGFTTAATLVDPTAIAASSVTLGDGSYVGAGVSIGALSRIGRFAFINRSASIGHHFEGHDFVSIGPGAVLAGQVRIESGATIGAGAVILPGVHVGAGAFVAAGSVVTTNVPPASLVARNPARLLKKTLAPWHDHGLEP